MISIDSVLDRANLFFKNKFTKNALPAPNLPYIALSPTDTIDRGSNYEQAIEWALTNAKEKDIKNIALTGPYGSGKSSVLKAYIKNNRDDRFNFLYISLATFKEEKTGEADAPKKDDVLRLIELSILQQIFYQEKDEKIPDSRFKKIKNHSSSSILWASVGWTLLALSVAYLKYPEQLKAVTDGYPYPFSPAALIYLRLFAVVISFVGIIKVISKSIRVLSKVRLNKFNLFDTEIEVGEKIEKSILNQHIDEIVYFFEVTNYNVVVIEDLDRFNQTEIFTKLREINLIINLSKQVNKEIIFIYAVRDDMFQDKDRAKFFDFIIPIIPVINSTNSSQQLIKHRDTNKYLWTNDLIENLSIFINDMRLLYNITNEFYLYQKKQSPKLDQSKLLALLVYKNIYPEDFTNLSYGKGILYNALISKKKEYISDMIEKINDRIIKVESEIQRQEAIKISDVKELRAIYLLKFIEKSPGFSAFAIQNDNTSISQMLEAESFAYLISNKARYYRNNNGHYNLTSFGEIEGLVDNTKTYKERIQDIEDLNTDSLNDLKKERQELEQQKKEIRHYKVKDLVSKGNIIIADLGNNQNQQTLVTTLLRNGYIDEEYAYYISIFYEGSLTLAEHDFIVNVNGCVSNCRYVPTVRLMGSIRSRTNRQRSLIEHTRRFNTC